MKDIKCTEDNRLVFKSGDLVLVDGVDRIKQHIRTAVLGIMPGSWVLNPKLGIDYFSGLAAYTDVLKGEIKNSIRRVIGVTRLRNFDFDTETENYRVKGSVVVDNENLSFNEEIKWK